MNYWIKVGLYAIATRLLTVAICVKPPVPHGVGASAPHWLWNTPSGPHFRSHCDRFYCSFLRDYALLCLQLKELNHDNIETFVGACVEPEHICYLMQCVSRGTVRVSLHNDLLAPIPSVELVLTHHPWCANLNDTTLWLIAIDFYNIYTLSKKQDTYTHADNFVKY